MLHEFIDERNPFGGDKYIQFVFHTESFATFKLLGLPQPPTYTRSAVPVTV
jgi:hypothetical protein